MTTIRVPQRQVRAATPAPWPVQLAEAEEVREFAPRRLLVATDGRSLADGALRVARAIADRDGASVAEVAVCEPRIPVPVVSGERRGAVCEAYDEPALSALACRVREQSRRVVGEARDWPLHVTVGYPAAMIDRVARRERAELILAGLGPGTPEDRLFSKETALAVAFSSDVPVLAVALDAYRLPRRALVVLEQDEASVGAAHAAVALMEDGGTLYLVHVRRGAPVWTLESGWALHRLFERAEAGAAERGITVRRLVVDGDPVPAILSAAERRGVELIATALHGGTVPERSVMPNLAAPLLREARCSVLVVPER